MVVVELLVNEEKLTALLREQSESESLDYKDAVDLSNPRHLVEFTKDVGAMQAFGGYLVIGVDAAGAPTGSMSPELARLFDEATLRPKLTKRLTLPFTVLSQSHLINGHTVILVYVGPHADGLAVFASDGLYDVPQSGGKSKSVTLFRAGEVFVRHGTSSERWNQSDVPRLLAKRDARIREEARADLASALAAVERGTRAQGLARGPVDAFTSQLDQGTFDATATELLRTGDRTPIRLLLVRAVGDAEASVLGGDLEGLQTLLDRLARIFHRVVEVGGAVVVGAA